MKTKQKKKRPTLQPFEHANLWDAFPLEREQAKKQTKKDFQLLNI